MTEQERNERLDQILLNHDERIARLDRMLETHQERMQELAELQRYLVESSIKHDALHAKHEAKFQAMLAVLQGHDAYLDELSAAQQHTDERLNAVVAVVDGMTPPLQ